MPMDYRDVMTVLSQSGLGAALLGEHEIILSVNETGDHLLHGEGTLEGQSLWEIAAPLCQESEEPLYANIAFGEYLIRCPAPEVDGLPPRTRLIVFRNAANDACHDMLISMLNQISEAAALFDAKGRMYLMNDAAVKMESLTTQDVLGEHVSDIYRMLDGSKLTVPQALQEKRAIKNRRLYYATCFGKNIDVVSSTYPITQNGQVLGAFTVMQDWSQIETLQKQIMDLQDKLLNQASNKHPKTKSALTAQYQFSDIVYVSSAMRDVIEQCGQVARNDSSVMIYGETGTGKEMFAQSIHNASRRADRPFLAINCAAIPENLLEGLLFGTERGAYTGAEQRAGLFEQADGGTLLLDEINSMNINLQSKLLRVLQEGTFRRVGGSAEIHVNVRLLSNTNVPPYQAIQEGNLRQDLFYRLGVVNITIPPLRTRREDIGLLAKRFIIRCNQKLEKNVKNISKATLDRFQAYHWPGNVRELQHAIEHAMNILPDELSTITPAYLPEHILSGMEGPAPQPVPKTKGTSLHTSIRDAAYQTICQALRESGGNISEAARALNMSRQNLQYRIKRYQIDVNALLREKLK